MASLPQEHDEEFRAEGIKVLKLLLPDVAPSDTSVSPESRISNKMRALADLGRKHGFKSYNPHWMGLDIYTLILMEKMNQSCIINNSVNVLTRSGGHLGFGLGMLIGETYPLNNLENIGNELKHCIRRGNEVICIPLTLQTPLDDEEDEDEVVKKYAVHSNLLIYRPGLKIVERYEPHGAALNVEVNSQFNVDLNETLREIFEDDLKQYIGNVKYIESDESCPSDEFKGAQYLEDLAGHEKGDGNGSCAMWMLFMMELVLLNPKETLFNIQYMMSDHSFVGPAFMRNLVRGYIIQVEDAIDKLIQTLRRLENATTDADGHPLLPFQYPPVTPLMNSELTNEQVADAHKAQLVKFFSTERDRLSAWFLRTKLLLESRNEPYEDYDESNGLNNEDDGNEEDYESSKKQKRPLVGYVINDGLLNGSNDDSDYGPINYDTDNGESPAAEEPKRKDKKKKKVKKSLYEEYDIEELKSQGLSGPIRSV